MAARKKQKTRSHGNSPVRPADAPHLPPVPPARAATPSAFQKCLLGIAVFVEASWIAALVAMALAE